MKNTVKKLLPLLVLFRTALLLTSCASSGEREGTLWTGTLPGGEGKRASSWELSLDGGNRVRLTLPYGDRAVVTGEAFPGDGGVWTVYTDELDWFGNWHRGWTEARFSLTGSFDLVPRKGGWVLEIREKPEITGLAAASLRLGEERIYGDRGRDIVARRWARVERAAQYAGTVLGRREFPFADRKGRYADRGPFEELEDLFFRNPEGCSALPEDLVPVVESGTLHGDYEAGEGLFYLALTWDYLWDVALSRSSIETRSKQ